MAGCEIVNIHAPSSDMPKPDSRMSLKYSQHDSRHSRYAPSYAHPSWSANYYVLRSSHSRYTLGCMKEKIVEMFPGLSDAEQQVAAENLDRYLELAWEIYQDLQSRDA